MEPILFSADELNLMADDNFFRVKARIMKKVRATLDALYAELRSELNGVELLAPRSFNPKAHQFVKGEHLEEFPYQYLDYFKHFDGDNKFTFRSLFWWGHHYAFALILEGEGLSEYKKNLVNRYDQIADKGLLLCLGGSPWEWKHGEGYTMELTWARKVDLVALLSNRSFLKLARFVPFDDPIVSAGKIVDVGRATLQDLIPVITL
ncbi:MAG TPA: hypothetical protein VGJ57_00895 [Nitrospirales bacterium]|jgi:hypothetical protein